MEIYLKHSDKRLFLVYDDKGVLEHVIEGDSEEKMMLEYTQEGNGYEFEDHNGYVKMRTCKAIYVRIMDLDIFVPKFIYIKQHDF